MAQATGTAIVGKVQLDGSTSGSISLAAPAATVSAFTATFQASNGTVAYTEGNTWTGTQNFEGATVVKFRDSNTSFTDDLDNTKAFKFQVSGITAATTRTITVPDADFTLPQDALVVHLAGNETMTGLKGIIHESTDIVTSRVKAIDISMTANGASASTNEFYGGFFLAQTKSGNAQNYNSIQGFQSRAFHNGTGLISGVFAGFQSVIANLGGGSITNAYGARVSKSFSGGSITNLYGLKIEGMSDATVTNVWAIHCADKIQTTDATASTDYTTGSIITGGGLGVSNNGNFNGYLRSNGLKMAFANKTADYTMTENDFLIIADSTGAAFTITLMASPSNGQIFVFKKKDASANAVTISGNGKAIDTAASKTLNTQHQVLRIMYSGAEWWEI